MNHCGPTREWRCRDRVLRCGEQSIIMGVLNVTPDSFSDGGRYVSPELAVARAQEMLDDGADIIDVGGESSRPGAAPVPVEEEMNRVLPVIQAISHHSSAVLSIDTTKVEVARSALASGAHIINDITAGEADPTMLDLAAETGAGLVLMHMQGRPQTMQDNPKYADLVADVTAYLSTRAELAQQRGVSPQSIAVDPGIGFGKTFDHNWMLLSELQQLSALPYPVLIGISRKRFLGELCGREVDERMPASLAAAVMARSHGAAIIRVHDVKETCDALRVTDRLLREEAL